MYRFHKWHAILAAVLLFGGCLAVWQHIKWRNTVAKRRAIQTIAGLGGNAYYELPSPRVLSRHFFGGRIRCTSMAC